MSQKLEGLADAYKPPAMDYEVEPQLNAGGSQAVFVVAPAKLLVLGVASLGFYSLYWFYKHWALQRRAYALNIWPVARAIFSIFFVHQLFKAFHTQAAERGPTPAWQPGSQATLFVVLSVVSNLVARMGKFIGESLALDLASTALGLAALLPMVAAQRVANAAAGDSEGRSNASYSAGNIVVIVLGGLFWLAAIYGFATGYEDP